ncbi:MAG: cytidine/deoxycytidylate deaminase family protein [Thermoplasmata archaeon]
MSERLSLDQYFMNMAYLVSQRSTCLRRQVGAVLVKDTRVLATGYNGAPKGLKHCSEVGCMRMGRPNIELYAEEEIKEVKKLFAEYNTPIPSGYRHELCRGVHAEQNAIIQSAVFGTSIKDTTIYSTTYPCVICAKMLINASVVEIVYDGEYVDPLSKKLLDESKTKVRRFTDKIPEKLKPKETKLEVE